MKRYEEIDFQNLKSMYESRGILDVKHEELPLIGYITENAACFLLTTNSKVCFLENLVSRKGNHDYEVDAVMNSCLNLAKELGFEKVFGLCDNHASTKRASHHGFRILNQKVFVGRII